MKKISIMILVLVVALASCKKTPEVNLKYVDVNRDLITMGTTTANIQCDYEYIATLKKAYFCYGEGETNMNSAEMRVVQNTLYVELVGLRENTTYSYYYEFHNGFNSMRTALKSFKTEVSPTSVTLPTVVTASVTEITTNSAKCGGEVTNDGGAEVTERGICWSTNANPTLNDSHIAAGTGMGAFTAAMSNLEPNTTYHVRAYATNEAGTAYGLDREFVTLSNGGGGGSGNAPTGAINGLFTINEDGDQVYFSQGNLQYQASTNTWRFAEHQWDYVGCQTPYVGLPSGTVSGSDNSNISQTYNGWIDLFCWGTSGYNHGAVYYQPWSAGGAGVNSDFYAYGQSTCNLYDQTGQADWGYNAISNGGNLTNIWRTLSLEEWEYVLFNRNTFSEIRYVKGRVNNIDGIILVPDNWSTSTYTLNNANDYTSDYSNNVISASQWSTLQTAGTIFLPASGGRLGTLVVTVNDGSYWSSECSNIFENAWTIDFTATSLNPSTNGRYGGYSVRLIQNNNTQK